MTDEFLAHVIDSADSSVHAMFYRYPTKTASLYYHDIGRLAVSFCEHSTDEKTNIYDAVSIGDGMFPTYMFYLLLVQGL